jgi:hypothetical protein
MDLTQEETQEESVQDLFDRIKKSLATEYTSGSSDNQIKINQNMYGAVPSGYGADTITLNSPTTTFGNITAGLTASSAIYTTGTTGIGLNYSNASPWATYQPTGGKITLEGDGADIEVNGKSLMDMIGKIEERLNILTPNEKMEAEWDQLRELGAQYRALEAKLKEQSEMWNTLKKMPPPEIK